MKNNKQKNAVFVLDFENDKNGVIVLWYIQNLYIKKDFLSGEKLKDFFEYIKKLKYKKTYFYIHNLSYDGNFIISYLLRHGVKYYNKNILKNNTFNSFISDNNSIYNIKYKQDGKMYIFLDSKKVIDKSVKELAKNINIKKIKIDFEEDLKKQDIKTRCKNDVLIVSEYLRPIIKKYGVVSTASKMALDNFKKYCSKSDFFNFFPLTKEQYNFFAKSHCGGICFLNPRFKNKTIKNVSVYDINNTYPYIMATAKLPIGIPIYYKGAYKKDKLYSLYIQHIKADFSIKQNKIPFIKDQRKYYSMFSGSGLESSNGEIIDLYLTGDELKLFIESYNIHYIRFIEGYKFLASNKIFKKYIRSIYAKRIKAKKNHDIVADSIYKILCNGLYGKLASKLEYYKKIPRLDEEGYLIFGDRQKIETDGFYIPMAVFITSYARIKLLQDINNNIENFIYSDTDCIHTIGKPQKLHIDEYELGAYKLEKENATAKYIKEKCYIIQDKHEFKKVVAGAGEYLKKQITFDNFKIGAKYYNLKMKRTEQGVILDKDIFKIT